MKIIKAIIVQVCTAAITLTAMSQENQGVRFENCLTWEQVIEKAKTEHKYIFVDCYASWCGPCKAMDKNVYPNDNVGELMNARFVSVKVQMDTSKSDGETVKRWYADAHKIMEEYKVNAYPTFLFFSSEGTLVHRGLGYQDPGGFIKMVNNAEDPRMQVYTLLHEYQQGKKDYATMPYLAASVNMLLKDKELANAIGNDYLQNYLYKQGDDEIYTKENLGLIGTYVQSTREKGFDIFLHNGRKIDEIVRPGYAQAVVDHVITGEFVTPNLHEKHLRTTPLIDDPDWAGIALSIRKKYEKATSDRIIVNAQLLFYMNKKDYPNLEKAFIHKQEKYGLDTAGMAYLFTNNMIWDVIFLHSSDKASIDKGIQWMKIICAAHPNSPTELDTYANLLYKAGRVNEALAVEQNAASIEDANAEKGKRTPDKTYAQTVVKMKNGEPTWNLPN